LIKNTLSHNDFNDLMLCFAADI